MSRCRRAEGSVGGLAWPDADAFTSSSDCRLRSRRPAASFGFVRTRCRPLQGNCLSISRFDGWNILPTCLKTQVLFFRELDAELIEEHVIVQLLRRAVRRRETRHEVEGRPRLGAAGRPGPDRLRGGCRRHRRRERRGDRRSDCPRRLPRGRVRTGRWEGGMDGHRACVRLGGPRATRDASPPGGLISTGGRTRRRRRSKGWPRRLIVPRPF